MIRQPAYFWIAAIAFVVFLFFSIEQKRFLNRSIETMGTVTDITPSNGLCGTGKRRARYSCTRYKARILFYSKSNSPNVYEYAAGRCTGHNQPLSCANFQINDKIPVIYDPSDPSKTYENTFFAVWKKPLIALLISICALIASFFDPQSILRKY